MAQCLFDASCGRGTACSDFLHMMPMPPHPLLSAQDSVSLSSQLPKPSQSGCILDSAPILKGQSQCSGRAIASEPFSIKCRMYGRALERPWQLNVVIVNCEVFCEESEGRTCDVTGLSY